MSEALTALRRLRPLVHCLTNDVVQEITANVLLAAGASPAMVVAEQEVESFAAAADALLINVGTLFESRLQAMKLAVAAAQGAKKPWVLDPVAAGGIPWRDARIQELAAMKPTVIRGNASEILALTGAGSGGKGVDSTASSEDALPAASALAKRLDCTVCVTGKTDFSTDGERILAVSGGHSMATLVVGTGCSLSALVAAYCAAVPDPVAAAAAACMHAKLAAEAAWRHAQAPGSFHAAYIDALFELQPADFA